MDQNNWMLMMCPSVGPDGVIIGDTLYSTFMNGTSGDDLVYWNATSLTGMNSPPAMAVTGLLPNLNYQSYPRIDNFGNALAIVWKQNVNGSDQLPIRFTNNINAGLTAGYDTVDLGNITNADVALANGSIFVVWQDDNSATVRYRSGTFTPFSSVNEIQRDEITLDVYPNPGQGLFTLACSGNMAGIEVRNMLGEVLMRTEPGQKTSLIDLSACAAGLYLVKVVSGGHTQTRKIIIQ